MPRTRPGGKRRREGSRRPSPSGIEHRISRNVSCRHPQHRGRGDPALRRRPLLAGKQLFLLGLHHRHHQSRRGDGAAQDPALAHYRRQRPPPGRARRRRCRGGTGAQGRRVVRIYQRRTAADPLRLHGRSLRHGERERRKLRDRSSRLLARQRQQQADHQRRPLLPLVPSSIARLPVAGRGPPCRKKRSAGSRTIPITRPAPRSRSRFPWRSSRCGYGSCAGGAS
jgi:hypothetical protein